jgi:hypothetical protein
VTGIALREEEERDPGYFTTLRSGQLPYAAGRQARAKHHHKHVLDPVRLQIYRGGQSCCWPDLSSGSTRLYGSRSRKGCWGRLRPGREGCSVSLPRLYEGGPAGQDAVSSGGASPVAPFGKDLTAAFCQSEPLDAFLLKGADGSCQETEAPKSGEPLAPPTGDVPVVGEEGLLMSANMRGAVQAMAADCPWGGVALDAEIGGALYGLSIECQSGYGEEGFFLPRLESAVAALEAVIASQQVGRRTALPCTRSAGASGAASPRASTSRTARCCPGSF